MSIFDGIEDPNENQTPEEREEREERWKLLKEFANGKLQKDTKNDLNEALDALNKAFE